MFYHPAHDVSTALIFMDRRVQRCPDSDKGAFATVRFHLTEKANGVDVDWNKGGGRMPTNAFRAQQYILMWGDGDLREKVKAVSKKALAGQLNKKVYVLPEPAARPASGQKLIT